jgi:hypothetical protein
MKRSGFAKGSLLILDYSNLVFQQPAGFRFFQIACCHFFKIDTVRIAEGFAILFKQMYRIKKIKS